MKSLQLGVSLSIVMVIVAACTATTLPEYDVSPLFERARATADIAIASTQTAQAAQIASQMSHAEQVQSADADNGAILFTTFQADAGFACSTCHWVDSETPLIGPGLLNVATRAESRVDDTEQIDYLYDSIVNPDAFVVESFSADLMPENWSEIYSDAQIYDIIAYLLTLSDGTTTASGETTEQVVEIPDIVFSADADNGAILFTTFQADAGFACSTCHWIDSENPLIGPGLLNIVGRAGTRVEGVSAYDYLYTSIVNPDAFVVEPFSADLMPENWSEIYTDEKITDIIAYLWTLDAE